MKRGMRHPAPPRAEGEASPPGRVPWVFALVRAGVGVGLGVDGW